MLGDVTDDATIKFNVLWPDIGVIHMSIKSAGLGNFLQIPNAMALTKIGSRLESQQDDEE